MRYLILFILLVAQNVSAQSLFLEERPQRNFQDNVPPGNYSGMVCLGDDRYAVVSDKSETDGYFIFRILVDSLSGDIRNVTNEGFHSVKAGHSDLEAVAYNSDGNLIYLCGEADGIVVEVDAATGTMTGRKLDLNQYYLDLQDNGGMESFCFDTSTKHFWTINERPLKSDESQGQYALRLKSFSSDFSPVSTYAYRMDPARAVGKSGMHVMGVSEVTAIGNGRLLVLEREFYVPKAKLGAWCVCKIFEVCPTGEAEIASDAQITEQTHYIHKEKVCEWKTTLTVFGRSIANYEGMCLGPTLKDGRRTLLLIADSQNQYRHVLRDWFKSVVLSPYSD